MVSSKSKHVSDSGTRREPGGHDMRDMVGIISEPCEPKGVKTRSTLHHEFPFSNSNMFFDTSIMAARGSPCPHWNGILGLLEITVKKSVQE